MALVMLLLAALLLGVTFYSGRTMDNDAIARQRALIDNAFTTRINRAVGELRSVAWWDDTMKYTDPDTFDLEWLDQEIGSYMFESYHHDRLIILDESNRPIYVYGENTGLGTKVLSHDLRAAAHLIDQARGGRNVSPRVISTAKPGELYEIGQTENRKYSRGFGAIIQIDGQPAIATALLITPSFDTSKVSPKRRIALSIINITPEVLTDIGSSSLMPDLAFHQAGAEKLGQFVLKTDDGKRLATLDWTPTMPGTEMVNRVLPGILVVVGVAVAFLLVLMRRLLSSTRSLAEREVESRFLANHDALTGLPNRRQLEHLYERHSAHDHNQNTRLAVACVDLDRFKDINDTLGHHAGDQLIKAVADRLRKMLSVGDTLARLGGDEFAILRPAPWGANFDGLCQLIDTCFEKPFEVTGHKIDTAASTGIYLADDGDSFDEAIRRADIALYDAKANGRGRASRFTEAMAQAVEERRSIEVDLKRAIAARELTLNYQPIVEASTGAVASVEALVRWTSPTHGTVSPQLFVNIAEEAGMMADLGRFVIQQAIEDALRWPELTTAINISPAQLRSATILSDLLDPCRKLGVSPKRITIEITESVLMSNDDRTLKVLRRIKEEGFTLALDDFGTGYSSLAYLRDFPFDRLKIDRSFVKGLSVNDRALAIVEGVVNFGRILGREIVAEGIETEQEMQAMQQVGCTHLQGFLFSRPLPADHVEALAATFGKLASPHRVRSVEGGAGSAELVPIRSRKSS